MIPPFNDLGYLPPGVHPATLEEVDARFGAQSEIRRVQMESVREMVDLAARARVKRIVLNGSFVTDTIEPVDVDCVVLIDQGTGLGLAALRELRKGLPFLDLKIARARAFEEYVHHVFATDRLGHRKGIIELAPWSCETIESWPKRG
jgi:hypothetical protein